MHPFQVAIGYEQLSGLTTLAEGLRDRYQTKVLKSTDMLVKYPEATQKKWDEQEIIFACTDALSEDNRSWGDQKEGATMMFTHSTAFDSVMMNQIAEVTENMAIGSVVITCTKPLPKTRSKWLTLLHDRLPVAWGTVRVWTYEKLTSEVGAKLLESLASTD